MFQFKSGKPDELEPVGFKLRIQDRTLRFKPADDITARELAQVDIDGWWVLVGPGVHRQELTDEVVFKPLTLALLITGIFAAGLLIGGGTVFLAIAAALA